MIKNTAAYIKKELSIKNPETAIILGSGLGGFSQVLENVQTLNYKDIPNFPQSTVTGHKGQLLKGFINNQEVLCLNGRFHLYEGHDASVIAYVIHVLKELGIKRLIVTNAAGSLRKDMPAGSLMLITDHINFSGKNPLVGPNDESYGPRFPAMNGVYTPSLQQKIKNIAKQEDISLKEGVYLMVLGPNFETPAEVRAFGMLGADAVGMSTVPEVIAAAHSGIDVLGISVITNYAAGLVNNTPSHQETIEEANKAATNLTKLLIGFFNKED